MNAHLLIGIAAIVVLGIAAQWLAWRMRLPSILVLLIFGFAAGPASGFLNPDQLFGDILFPIVSLSVAIILFEGGLTLKIPETREVGNVIRNMISIGLLFTWASSAAAAYYELQLSEPLAILLGAILVVTGPTVILPVLRSVRPTGQVNSILKWEGILNDPIGAILAVLVFEAILATGLQEATTGAIGSILKTIFVAGSIGILGAYAMVLLLKHRLIPEFLQNPITLTMVVSVFTLNNQIQSESGLFAVTAMGIFLANQKTVAVKHIIEFKENLRVMLLSFLFIILAARLSVADLQYLNPVSILYLGILIFVIRPVAVVLSTLNSVINWKEKLFLSWMAPRGIIAAAVASLFALELSHAGYPGAQRLVPLVFLVIIGTISIYGLSAMPLARWLGIGNPHPQGCLIIGAHRLGVDLGFALQEQGIKVLLVDTNWSNVAAARMKGLPAYYGSAVSEYILKEIDLEGIGRLLALTPNQEVNALATIYFAKIFGSNEVYQLGVERNVGEEESEAVSQELRGNVLFSSSITYPFLEEQLNQGAQIKATPLTANFDFQSFKTHYEKKTAIPLFLIDAQKNLIVFTSDIRQTPQPGETLITLINSTITAS